MKKTIAVDFDGTLAHYEGYDGVGRYGPPVLSMVERINKWTDEGHEVVIFTARLAPVETETGDYENTEDQCFEAVLIRKWLKDAGIKAAHYMEITCIKHKRFTEIWDDRAVAVQRNTGHWFSHPPKGYNYMLVKGDEVLGRCAPIKQDTPHE